MASLAEMDLMSLIKETKTNICAVCQKNINHENLLKFPCGCNMCDKTCLTKCLKLIFNKNKDFKDGKYL